MIYEVWSFCLRTIRQLVQLGRCFWEPSCISHQKTSQQDRALLFPSSFLPQNDGCSFLLSDAPRRAAEQPQTIWQLWTQRANIRGSASPTNSLQIQPPLHHRLCIKNGFIHTKKAFNQKISFHHSFQEVMHLWEALWGFFYDTDGMTWLFRCGINSCVITESDLTIAAPFSVYLYHLSGIENCRTQKSGMLWDSFSQASKRLLSLLKAEISCVKTDDAVLFQEFSLIGFGIDGFAFRSFFIASPCRWESGESGNAVIKFSFCRCCRVKMEQHWPLLVGPSSAEARLHYMLAVSRGQKATTNFLLAN